MGWLWTWGGSRGGVVVGWLWTWTWGGGSDGIDVGSLCGVIDVAATTWWGQPNDATLVSPPLPSYLWTLPLIGSV